jgi:hypothetical protein
MIQVSARRLGVSTPPVPARPLPSEPSGLAICNVTWGWLSAVKLQPVSRSGLLSRSARIMAASNKRSDRAIYNDRNIATFKRLPGYRSAAAETLQ